MSRAESGPTRATEAAGGGAASPGYVRLARKLRRHRARAAAYATDAVWLLNDFLRLVGWRTKHASYWVSNTLLQNLSQGEMLGVARSLTRSG